MFALIWWIHSKKSSVIPYNTIKFSAKKEASVLQRKKFHSVKILRTSEDNAWLESLKVDGDGNVYMPEDNIHKKNLRARKRESSKEGKELTSEIKKRKLQRDLKLAKEPSIFEEIDKPPAGKTRDATSREEESKNTDSSSEESQLYIGFLQGVVGFLKDHGCSSSSSSKTVVETKDSPASRSSASGYSKMPWNLSGPRKVELHPMSDVYIESCELDCLKTKYTYDPKEMSRQIFKKVIGTDNLLKMSRTGGNGWTRLPNDVFTAVHGFISKNARPKLSAAEFERCVTLMFTSLRPGQ
ncbi:Protein of unknown function [Cotesia congregata]|uniref:Uncharacterized protein n=1 Tax=Cotesia congregata TaxID=51543 RepID=A0A8J2HD02_COTCN|nr:Protein of unknown function [Cotesia congregata]